MTLFVKYTDTCIILYFPFFLNQKLVCYSYFSALCFLEITLSLIVELFIILL